MQVLAEKFQNFLHLQRSLYHATALQFLFILQPPVRVQIQVKPEGGFFLYCTVTRDSWDRWEAYFIVSIIITACGGYTLHFPNTGFFFFNIVIALTNA